MSDGQVMMVVVFLMAHVMTACGVRKVATVSLILEDKRDLQAMSPGQSEFGSQDSGLLSGLNFLTA